MSKSNEKKDQIQEILNFNEDKTTVSFTLMSKTPITEEEFLYCLSDFIRCFGDGFNFSEVGELVPFDLFEDQDPPDGIFH